MKKLTIAISIILFSFVVKAQYMTDLQGRVMMEISHTDVTGNPYLYDSWLLADVKLINGDTYSNVPVKYNIYKDEELYFKNSKDESMLSFVVPVKSFVLNTISSKVLYESGFPSIDDFNDRSFYEVVYDGKAKLLFKKKKTVLETKAYNSATTEKSFQELGMYYIFKDDKMEKFKPSKKDILEIFSNKSTHVEAFMKKEKINFKSSTDLEKVFEYYYSL